MQYRRLSDNQMVSASEACDAAGCIKDGYALSVPYGSRMAKDGEYIGFSMAFMDSAAGGQSALSDPAKQAIVARAEMQHRTRYGYLGDKAPAFTQAHAAAAVRSAETSAAQLADSQAEWGRGADAARAANITARQMMIDAIRNAWRQ